MTATGNDNLNDLANKFVNLWQENFQNAMNDAHSADSMQHILEQMQVLYGKQDSTTANTGTSFNGNDELSVEQLRSRIDELEARVAELEANCSKD